MYRNIPDSKISRSRGMPGSIKGMMTGFALTTSFMTVLLTLKVVLPTSASDIIGITPAGAEVSADSTPQTGETKGMEGKARRNSEFFFS